MIIKYYNNSELSYSSRQRYHTFNFSPFSQEEQGKVLLGDGANTSLKTKRENLCDYVTIDDTRWFVTSFIHINGGQVKLFLQRDVVGEKGIDGMYGKVERGFTDSILKNRKELSVNEVLKSRKKLIPNTNVYGNYTVNNHDNELWGIMYFAKPSEIDPNTGEPFPDSLTINIPAFAPDYVNYPLIEDGSKFSVLSDSNVTQNFTIYFTYSNQYEPYNHASLAYDVKIEYFRENGYWDYVITKTEVAPSAAARRALIHTYQFRFDNDNEERRLGVFVNKNTLEHASVNILDFIADKTISNQNAGIKFPQFPENIPEEQLDYNNVTVKEGTNFYSFTSSESITKTYGSTSFDDLSNLFETEVDDKPMVLPLSNGENHNMYPLFNFPFEDYPAGSSVFYSEFDLKVKTYKRTQIDEADAGNITIDLTQQLVDEPYSILVFPLYDVNIGGSTNHKIQKKQAFMIFNTVVQYLSGDNPYLIDAQIYPYCPVLTGISSQINGYPFFKINSNTYNHNCKVQLLPSSDVKFEYITRKYSIISPEQTGKFDFNYYDYFTEIENINGVNQKELNILIKTALKPFSIISAAVITPSLDSIIGITYPSDLRGPQPSSNGFECSLSSNAFETYKRQNSNYQQIFGLQKEELALQHQTEKVNEITGAVVNTVTATAFGAIGGAALADYSFLGSSARGAGAAVGAGVAGAAVGAAQGIQVSQNEKLRDFEKNLQQQNFDLAIGTIKALPNSVNRISSFNEIILQDFWYVIETYECTDYEKTIVRDFIDNYGYGIGVFSFVKNFYKSGWFLRSTLIKSGLVPNLHNIASNELMGGIYYYE